MSVAVDPSRVSQSYQLSPPIHQSEAGTLINSTVRVPGSLSAPKKKVKALQEIPSGTPICWPLLHLISISSYLSPIIKSPQSFSIRPILSIREDN